jgi:hypothetical protein
MRVCPVPDAALGGTDTTRRWGIADDEGRVRWAGLTRPEAEAACGGLDGLPAVDLGDVLVRVELGVVLSDGAGPYLVDTDGVLVLVLGPHRASRDAHIAMGQPTPGAVRIGAVRDRAAAGTWRWMAQAEVAAERRDAALDGLDAAATRADLAEWADRWGGRASPTGMP